jgi:hypothetical protein
MNFWVYTPARSGVQIQILFNEKDVVKKVSYVDEDLLCGGGSSLADTALCYLLYK